MAQRTIVVLEDDLDGGEATDTVEFALDGKTYEIDLNHDHAAQMRDAFAPYVGAARRAGGQASSRPLRTSPRGSAPGRGGPGAEDPKAVRTWAEANGVAVNARGRLSASVLAQYRSATGA